MSSKIQILKNLINFVDDLIIGGGMAYTFIKSQGGEIGNSLVEEIFLDEAQNFFYWLKIKMLKFIFHMMWLFQKNSPIALLQKQ